MRVVSASCGGSILAVVTDVLGGRRIVESRRPAVFSVPEGTIEVATFASTERALRLRRHGLLDGAGN